MTRCTWPTLLIVFCLLSAEAVTIDHVVEKTEDHDSIQYKIMGTLSLVFGTVLSLGVLIPNHPGDRVMFVLCGGAIMAVGGVLLMLCRRKREI